jgi:hypothetical protein
MTDDGHNAIRLDAQPCDAANALTRHDPANAPACCRCNLITRGDLAAFPFKKE